MLSKPTRAQSLGLILAATMAPLQVFAAGTYPFYNFEELRGLIVEAIYEDSHGYIWVATESGIWRGQNRGFEALDEHYGQERQAHCLLELPEGTMWVGTDFGLRAFDVNTLERLTVAQIDELQVHCLFEHDDGDVLIGTGQGLYRMAASRHAAGAVLIPGTQDMVIFSIAAGENGDIWLGAKDALARITPQGQITRPHDDIVGNGPVRLLRAADGALWIGLRHDPGLYRLAHGTLTRMGPESGLLNDEVNALFESRDGTLWVGTEDGVFVYMDGRFTAIQREHGLRNTDVHSVLVDREDMVWIGTFGSGAVQLRSLAIRTYHVENGLPHPMVMDLDLTADGRLLVATLGGAVAFDEDGDQATILERHHVDRVCVEPGGAVWMSGSRRVWRLDDALSHAIGYGVLSLAPGPDNGVFAGGSQGMVTCGDSTLTTIPLPKALGKHVETIVQVANDTWLVGTPLGLARWRNDEWTTLLTDVGIQTVARGHDDVLWIGTQSSLQRLVDGRPRDVAPESMKVGQVVDIVCQSDGTVWAASRRGLLRYRDGVLHRFTVADGLPCHDVRALKLDPAENWLYAGTSEGLAHIDTRRLHPPRMATPRVAIQDWSAGGTYNSVGVERFELSHHHQDIHVRVQCLGWRNAGDVRYTYRLEGRDTSWSAPTAQRRFHFSGLPPKAYTLHVRAVNAHGVTSDRDVRLSFTVLPPWWREPRFIAMATTGLLAFGGAVLLVRVRRSRALAERRRRQALEQQVKSQLQHAKKMEAVGTLAAGVAHDFNNLLTAIIGYRDMASSAGPEDQRVREALDGIGIAATQGSQVVQSLLAFSRKQTQEKREVEVGGLVRETMRMLRPIVPAALNVSTRVPANEALWIRADATQLSQVLVNLVVNAMDATPQGGDLRITVEHRPARPGDKGADDHGQVVCVVEDTGLGMTPEVLERIFDPFFSTKTRERGTGLGLAVVHGIIEELGGHIDVDSHPGRGTRVTCTLPCCPAPSAAPASQPEPLPPRHVRRMILIAEDNTQLRSMIAQHLENCGHYTLEARDGRELLAVATEATTPPDVAIIDIDLPQTDGLTCLERLRQRWPALPAIVITGYPTSELDGMEADTRLMRKPFRMRSLVQEVDRLAGGAAQHPEPPA